MVSWIDTHCHLDAPELAPDVAEVRAHAAAAGVALCILPAVEVGNFEAVRSLAHRFGDAYALGIHPLCVAGAQPGDLDAVDAALTRHRDDARLVAVGEIGLDYFVPALREEPLAARQEEFYRRQVQLAGRHGLPAIVHVRRSADRLLKQLRAHSLQGGIAHAFNGSTQQAHAFLDLGFKLGFGGASTFERALQLRALARSLPLSALVLETDSPDIPPQWLYRTARQRADGAPQGRNTPAELPRIAAAIAALRGIAPEALAEAAHANALAALPRLAALVR